MKFKKTLLIAAILAGACTVPLANAYADDAASSSGLVAADGSKVDSNAAKDTKKSKGGGFIDIVCGGGVVGFLLWMALFGDGILAIYFCIDSSILIDFIQIF